MYTIENVGKRYVSEWFSKYSDENLSESMISDQKQRKTNIWMLYIDSNQERTFTKHSFTIPVIIMCP